MKKLHLALISVLLFGLSIFGQTTPKTEQISQNKQPQPKIFAGEDYMPNLFEPYRADYVFNGNIVGLNLALFSLSTKIIELADGWQETQNYHLPMIPDKNFQDVAITSFIDLKTGLLKKLVTETGKNLVQTIEIADGKILVTESDGKKVKSQSFESREKIYPCSFSNVFLSYLPLKEDFAGTFSCISFGETDSGKPKIEFARRTLRVVGTEKILTSAGIFECYKLADSVEEISLDKDGNLKTKENKNRFFDEETFWTNFYNSTWIDKKSRKVVKGEMEFKVGNLSLELQKSGKANL